MFMVEQNACFARWSAGEGCALDGLGGAGVHHGCIGDTAF
jgi:hypothetical protein